MTAMMDEIVHVRSAHFLIDSAWRVCPYATRNGQPLARGYYLTLRSPRAEGYDRRTRYYGPFDSRSLAEQMAMSARYLGVVESEQAHLAARGDGRGKRQRARSRSGRRERPARQDDARYSGNW